MTRVRFDSTDLQHPRDETPYWGEHAARYVFALPHVLGKRVLDIACGTGYGSLILRQNAEAVTGVDVDFEAARKANAGDGRGAIAVLVADGCKLPFGDHLFDAITSFETLEHLHDRDTFLKELRRTLRPEGKLVLSTPNANYTQPIDGKPRNRFHVHEYTPEELHAALQQHFSSVTLLGQVLDGRFRISPFWDAQQRLPRKPGIQFERFVWRVLNKMSVPVRNRASELLWNHSFLPYEHDYHFTPEAVETAPVLVAVCGGALGGGNRN